MLLIKFLWGKSEREEVLLELVSIKGPARLRTTSEPVKRGLFLFFDGSSDRYDLMETRVGESYMVNY